MIQCTTKFSKKCIPNDELGSTSHIASSAGSLVESYQYDVYGKPQFFDSTSQPLNSSTYGVKDLFTGQRWHSELGLYDDRNRFMSPDLGRFLQPDPIGFKGDASNLYRYCGNDWANRSDPMGLEGEATGLRGPDLTTKEVESAKRDWAAGAMMWDFEKRADTSGGNGSRDGRAARPDEKPTAVGENIGRGKAVNYDNAPMGPTNTTDAPAKLERLGPNTGKGLSNVFKLQTETAGGGPLTDKTVYSKETITIEDKGQKPNFKYDLKTSGWTPGRFGQVADRVGFDNKTVLKPGYNGEIYKLQSYQIGRDGFKYNVGPTFEQYTHVVDGKVVENRLTPLGQ
jgi:RHS repeat-associated protein